jgi:hypothetical protein
MELIKKNMGHHVFVYQITQEKMSKNNNSFLVREITLIRFKKK